MKWISLTKIKVSAGRFFWRLQGEPISLPFLAFRSHLRALTRDPCLHLQSQSQHLQVSLSVSDLLLPLRFHWAHWPIQGYVPISRPLTSSHLQRPIYTVREHTSSRDWGVDILRGGLPSAYSAPRVKFINTFSVMTYETHVRCGSEEPNPMQGESSRERGARGMGGSV